MKWIKKLFGLNRKNVCDTCTKQRTIKCPNSGLCYNTDNKSYWTDKKIDIY